MKTWVVKLGGSSLSELEQALIFVRNCQEARIVLVHGGGPQINDLLSRLGHQAVFHQGLRVTDHPTLEVAEMVLAGKVNKLLVAKAQALGLSAVGLCGLDGPILKAQLLDDGALGQVGRIDQVEVKLLELLLGQGYLPILAPLALGYDFATLNVNADEAASAVAAALGAESLVFLTNVDGLLNKNGQSIAELHPDQIDGLLADGTIGQGMIPKINSARLALERGVEKVMIRSALGGAGTVLKR